MEYLQRYQHLATERGGRLRSTQYINCRTKLIWECDQKHVWSALPLNISNGTWCPKCRIGRPLGDNLSRARVAAEQHGGRCLATINCAVTENVRWECAKKHQWDATITNVGRGRWCPTCALARQAASAITQMNDNLFAAQQIAASHGGKCDATKNFSIRDVVGWECAEGHSWTAVFYSMRRGSWCRICAFKDMGDMRRYDNLSRARTIAEERQGECLAIENFGVNDLISWRCEVGHDWMAHLSNIIMGTWCPRCRYKSEDMCFKVLAAIFPTYEFKRNIRSLEWLGVGVHGRPLELDVYNEQLRLGLEFNGFLHEGPVEAYGGVPHYEKIKEHDARKELACLSADVCLITVWFRDVTANQRQASLPMIVKAIWDEIADMGFPDGTHRSYDELRMALRL